MSTEQEIRSAVDRFYEALNQALNGDPNPMLEAWSQTMEVSAMHPAGGRHLGWEEVRGAWETWARSVTSGRIAAEEVAIRLVTPDVAYATATERGQGTLDGETVPMDGRATLLLRREGRAWKAVHHHVDVMPSVRDAAARAMARQAAGAAPTA